MANMDSTARILVDATPGIQSLKQLQGQVKLTNSAFAELKNGLTAIVAGSLIKSTYDMANALSDSAKAAGLTTGTLLAFSRAVQNSGGTMEKAAGGVDNFSQAVDAAATGSIKAQDQFAQLGITMTDLRTMSEEDLFKKMIAGLGNIDDISKRASIAMSIMGKAAKGVEMRNVAEEMKSLAAESDRLSASFDSAATARENINKTFVLFQAQLLTALEPVSKLANAVLESGRAIETFLKVAINIGLIVVSFTLLGKAIAAIRIGIAALMAGGAAVIDFFVGAANTGRNLGAILERLFSGGVITALQTFGTLLKTFGTWVLDVIPGLGALAAAIYAVYESLKLGVEWFGKWVGASDDASKKDKEAVTAKREVIDAFKKQRLEIEYISTAFGRANKLIVDQINLDNSLIGKTKEFSDVTKAQEEIFKRAADESEKLRKAKSELSEEEKRAGIGDVMDKQIKKIQQVADADAKRVEGVLHNGARLQSLEQLRLFGIQREIDLTNNLQGLQDTMAKSTMNELEKKYYDIQAAAKSAAKAAIEAEEARINRRLTPDEARAYYDAAIKGAEDLKKVTKEEYENSRKFSTGWKTAFNEYVDNAANGAQQAATIFNKFTSSMEDSLFKFFKTGKFGFRDMIQTMVDTLLRSQIQQLMGKVISGSGTAAGGAGSFLGGLLGFADGGTIPGNGPVLVGERGPELLSGAGGRTVTPNSALGGSVTYNINAVDANSFKQMIAADPSFLYAVSEQGRRRLPGAR